MIISRKSFMIFGLTLSASMVVNCSSKKPNKGGIASSENAAAAAGEQAAEESTAASEAAAEMEANKPNNKLEQLSSSFGLLNFRQVQHTLNNLTGVALNATAVAPAITPLAAYAANLSSLPTDFTAAAITAGKVAAMTKLSAVYCDALANNAALLAAKFPGLTLAAAPADSAAFAKTLVDGFFGPETSLQGVRATDIQTVAATVDALKGLNGTGPAIFMATCAGVVASAEIFLY